MEIIECENVSTRFLQHAVCQNACTRYSALPYSDACSTLMNKILSQKSSVIKIGVPKTAAKMMASAPGCHGQSSDLQPRLLTSRRASVLFSPSTDLESCNTAAVAMVSIAIQK